MKPEIGRIIRNWKPWFCKPYIDNGCGDWLTKGNYMGNQWESALNEKLEAFGWVATRPGAKYDSIIPGKIPVEIRTVTRSGVHFIKSSTSGSKATWDVQVRSREEKFKTMGEIGVFALMDIRDCEHRGVDVYTISVESIRFYLQHKLRISSHEFDLLIHRHAVDKTNDYVHVTGQPIRDFSRNLFIS